MLIFCVFKMYVVGEWCSHQNCLCFLSKQHLAFLTDNSLLSPSLLQHGWKLYESSISKPILQLSPAVFTKYFHNSYKYLLLIFFACKIKSYISNWTELQKWDIRRMKTMLLSKYLKWGEKMKIQCISCILCPL